MSCYSGLNSSIIAASRYEIQDLFKSVKRIKLHSLLLHCESDTVNFSHGKLFIHDGRIITIWCVFSWPAPIDKLKPLEKRAAFTIEKGKNSSCLCQKATSYCLAHCLVGFSYSFFQAFLRWSQRRTPPWQSELDSYKVLHTSPCSPLQCKWQPVPVPALGSWRFRPGEYDTSPLPGVFPGLLLHWRHLHQVPTVSPSRSISQTLP